MAIQANIKTQFGEDRDCYIRLNNVEANNHSAETTALFRAYLSAQAFTDGASYVAEFNVAFVADVSKPLWSQAYSALVIQEGFPKAEV